MASLNRVVLVGNLTKDPEIRNTPDGTPVANLRLAVNRQWTNKQGEREADFFNIVAWRKLAELCGQYLGKGSSVAIDGRLQSRSWDAQDGQRRTTVEIVADNIQFLNRASAMPETVNTTNVIDNDMNREENIPIETPAVGDIGDDDIPF
jgi:single-strand DNA-binding protein